MKMQYDDRSDLSMKTHLILHPLSKINGITTVPILELERSDKYDYVKLHAILYKKHIRGSNFFTLDSDGIDLFCGICDFTNIDLVEYEKLKIIGVDLL
jgi:hypothetical protein